MILQNTKFVGVGCRTGFSRTGGTPPYTFEVLAGGAGGTINSDGLYTAPNTAGSGKDTIRVTDSLGSVETASIAIYGPIKLFAEIIRKEMGLADDQVFLYNQKINIPKDDRLYIAIGVISNKPFSNTRKMIGNFETEELSMNVKADLSVNIMSKGMDALERKEEVLMSLKSQYAQTQQEANSFHIGVLPQSFVNLSEVEGSAIPYRFNISVPIQYAVRKTKTVAYYDQYEKVEIATDN